MYIYGIIKVTSMGAVSNIVNYACKVATTGVATLALATALPDTNEALGQSRRSLPSSSVPRVLHVAPNFSIPRTPPPVSFPSPVRARVPVYSFRPERTLPPALSPGRPRTFSPPLPGLPDTRRPVTPANFPNHPIPSTSYSVFAGPFGLWGSAVFPLPYPRNNRVASCQVQSNSCFQCEEPTNQNSDGIMCSNIKYQDSITPAEKAALEALREDSLKSLIENGYYPAINDQGQVINTEEQLRYYLTPAILAHAVLNKEDLEAIKQGLKNNNQTLKATYGNFKFFQDAVGAIGFHKVKQVGVTNDVLANDTNTIIKKLKETQRDISEKERQEFTIADIPQKAAFIARVYHRLPVDQLKMICEALTKASSEKETDREQITLEHKLYIEQLMMTDTAIIDRATFLLYIMTLNDSHSDDAEGEDKREAIQKFIKDFRTKPTN